MGLNLKTFTDFVRLINGKFNKEVPEIDPTIDASFAKASTVSSAAGAVSLQEGLKDVSKQSFYQTADDEFLELIGEYDDTERFDPQISIGFAAVGGVLGTPIGQDETLTSSGNTYIVTADTAVQNYVGNVSLSFSAGIVTAVTDLPHTLSSGLAVTISGATQPEYNGTFTIIALDENTFIYEIDAGSLTTDNGEYASVYALLNIESLSTGLEQNISAGGQLSINIPNINTTAFAGVGGITGGFDQENIEDYRSRVGESHNLTPGISTPPSLKFSAKKIAGNTRVFIVRPTNEFGGIPGEAGYRPELGETVVYVLRDNDSNILPSSLILDETKQQIINDGQWPTFIREDGLYVIAPILKAQPFNFTSIVPNTVTMQNAIRDQLVVFFQDNADIEGTITLSTLNSFLSLIQDPNTGELLRSYEYNSPAVDMTSGSGEILVRGDVTFE